MRRDSTLTCLDAMGRGDCSLIAHEHTTIIVEVEASLSHPFHHLFLHYLFDFRFFRAASRLFGLVA